MGTINQTLAAFGGETGGMQTNYTKLVGGKPFHLWTMRTPGSPSAADVSMDYDGPGPTNPFVKPPMAYSYIADIFTNDTSGCYFSGQTPATLLGTIMRVYFRCSFEC